MEDTVSVQLKQLQKVSFFNQGSLCVSFDDTRVISITQNMEGKVWDLQTGDQIAKITGHEGSITSANFNRQYLVSGSVDHKIRVFDLYNNGSCLSILQGHSGEICVVVNDDRFILSGAEDCLIKLWSSSEDFSAWTCSRTFNGHSGAVTCLQFDDKKIVSGSTDGTLRIWNISTGECSDILTGHSAGVCCLQFDSTRIISGSFDKTIKVWESGVCTRTLDGFAGHKEAVVCLQFDDKKIVSGSSDNTIKVWSMESGKCLYTLRQHLGPVWNLKFTKTQIISSAFDPDTHMLVFDFAFFAKDVDEVD